MKFTRLESTRRITVSIAASTAEPQSGPYGVRFIERKLVNADQTLNEDWKQGSTIYLQFCVSDTGRGLSEDEKSTLFARFSQASPRTHIQYGGSGLGLFISRRLTELQGGAIGLASQYKKGSTFSFYIKARRTTPTTLRRSSFPNVFPEDIKHRPHAPKDLDAFRPSRPVPVSRTSSAVHSDIPSEALGLPPDPPLQELKRRKSIPETLHVLVVEDNLVNQKVLAKQLRHLGCVVSVANHGLEALEHLKRTKFWDHTRVEPSMKPKSSSPSLSPTASVSVSPTMEPQQSPVTNTSDLPLDLSLILLDWEMPVMNGLTCVMKIRELERHGTLTTHIPVIGVTANVRQQQISEAFDKGMDDVVGKPFRVQELLGRMRGVVQNVKEKESLGAIREGEG